MKWIYILFSIVVMGAFFSCYDEKALTPTEDGEGMSRYEFPQGTNSWDKDIEAIAEEFNVYLIYKNFKHADFNRAWSGGGLGIEYYGEDLSDEYAELSARFMKEHVFAYLNAKILPKVLPMYYYMVYDLHVINDIMGIFVFKNPQTDYYQGLDFWAICLVGEDPEDSGMMAGGEKIDFPTTKREFFLRRGEVLKTILLKSCEKGNIEVPAGFETGFDYKTETLKKDEEIGNENHYLKRGFPGRMGHFSEDGLGVLNSIDDTNNARNFQDYICFGMFYSAAELDELYPRDEFPLLREKRDFVVKYLKTTYDLDLEAINEGPGIN